MNEKEFKTYVVFVLSLAYSESEPQKPASKMKNHTFNW